jgi:hypothetical protein
MSTDERTSVVSNSEQRGNGPIPRLLYKYLDRYGLDAIANLELRVTPPNEFNDPLEFTPYFLPPQDECDWEAAYELDKEQNREMSSVAMSEFKQRFSIEKNGTLLQGAWLPKASKQFGVLCLSSDRASVSMWARYSASHTGLVLELKLDTKPFSKLVDSVVPECGGEPQMFRQIRYCPPQKRRAFRLCELYEALSDKKSDAKFMKIFSTSASEKCGEWAPEREFRFIVPLNLNPGQTSCPVIRNGLMNGRVMFFLKLDANAISRIIIGERASPEFEREVRKAAALHGIDGRIVRARIDRQCYTVEVD